MHILASLGTGGAEMGVIRLIQSFPDPSVRHSICIFGGDQALRPAAAGIPIHSLDLSGPCYTAFRPLARLFKRERVDIAHVNNLAPWADTGLAAGLGGALCLETFHGVEQGQERFGWGQRQVFRLLASRSAAVTAVSAAAGELMTELTGIEQPRIRVIPNGVDGAHFFPASSAQEKHTLREALGLPVEALLFGCVAALRPVKDHRGLINAFAGISPAEREGCFLVLIGGGPQEGALKSAAAAAGLKESVLFLGPRDDVPQLLRALDLFVLNSQTEGLSYAVLEAMASGLPVVASAVGANPELIADGCEGFTYPAGAQDKLGALLAWAAGHREHLPAMGNAARRRVLADYGMDVMGRRYAELYHQVLESHGRKTGQ